MIFVSTRDGGVHIFHEDSPDHYSEAGKVKTELGAKTMAYDPEKDHIFVDTAEFGKAAEGERPRACRGRFICWSTGGCGVGRRDGGATVWDYNRWTSVKRGAAVFLKINIEPPQWIWHPTPYDPEEGNL
jgi:hypothetical protein